MPSASPSRRQVLAPVGAEDRVRDGRGGRVAVAVVDEHGHVVGGEHLERGGPGRLGEPVGVAADEQRSVVPLLAAVVADRLGGGQDVGLVERGLQAGAAVAAGAERDLLVDVLGVRHPGVVGGDEVGDVDEVAGLGRAGRRAVLRLIGLAGTSWPLASTVSPSSTTKPRARSSSSRHRSRARRDHDVLVDDRVAHDCPGAHPDPGQQHRVGHLGPGLDAAGRREHRLAHRAAR